MIPAAPAEHPEGAVATTYHVAQNHPLASDANSGTADAPFLTIAPAAAKAQPGDTILVGMGVYRERVVPLRGGQEGRPITYAAVEGAQVALRGSDVWMPDWQPVESLDSPEGASGVYRGKLDLAEANPFTTPLQTAQTGRTCGQIFVDGAPLLEVDSIEDLRALPGSWMAEEGGRALAVHFPTASRPLADLLVEITARSRVFAPQARGLGYIVVRGFIIEHCGNNFPETFWSSNFPQAGALGCRGGHHWVIENNTIRHAKTVGLDIGAEGRHDLDGLGQAQPQDSGHHIVRGNTISDNGAAGILGYVCPGSQITGNVLERNNCLGFTAPETAAIKLHFATDCLIESNLMRDNDTYGVWLDNVWRDSRVTRNVIVNNVAAGIFIEMGEGPLLVDHNIVAVTRPLTSMPGDGFYAHDASGVTLAHNLFFFNAHFGIWAHLATDRETRREGCDTPMPCRCSDWRILNNMVIGNSIGAISLPASFSLAERNVCDFNLLTSSYDLLTVETSALELGNPVFLLNTSKGRVSMREIVARFEASLDAAKIPHEARPSLPRWSGEMPMLTFKEWQLLTGHDTHSRVPRVVRPQLSTRTLLLSFLIDDAVAHAKAPGIEGVDRDFFGAPLGAVVAAGPFQTIHNALALSDRSDWLEHRGPYYRLKNTEANRYHLWPPRSDGSAPKQGNRATAVEQFQRDF
jgi:hypothetical protein